MEPSEANNILTRWRHHSDNLEELNKQIDSFTINAKASGHVQEKDLNKVQTAMKAARLCSTMLWDSLYDPIMRDASESKLVSELRAHDVKIEVGDSSTIIPNTGMDPYEDEEDSENLTLSVPNVRRNPYIAQISVHDDTYRGILVKEKAPPRNRSVDKSSDGGKFGENERNNALFKIVVAPPISEGRWIKHYSSGQRILLVGEGDFSFSTCLAKAFGWASNLIATSLDSQDFLTKNYHNALSNIVELSIRNCKVMHEIDATTIASHAYLGCTKFDRIIFNFPFAGFFKDLSRTAQLRLHRRLVSMFLKNAKELISEDGEIHVSHKTNGFHGEWKLEGMASSHRLRLIEAVDFDQLDYPGYNTKCGFGGDNNFNCYPSKTYKFGLKW